MMSEEQKKQLRCWLDILNSMPLCESERADRVVIAVVNILTKEELWK